MSSRHAPVRPGAGSASAGQYLCLALSVGFAVWAVAYTGFPTSASSPAFPLSYPSSSSHGAPDVGVGEPESHNWPSVRRPRMPDGALTGGYCKRKSWC